MRPDYSASGSGTTGAKGSAKNAVDEVADTLTGRKRTKR
jgi:hypothetical protein